MKSVSTSGGSSKSFLKRPKVLGNPNPSSAALTKRASTGGALVKVEKDTVKSTTGKLNLLLVVSMYLHTSKVYSCISQLSVSYPDLSRAI